MSQGVWVITYSLVVYFLSLIMIRNKFHQAQQNIFKHHFKQQLHFIYTIRPGRGSHFMAIRFHNSHPQSHRQNVRCLLYVRQLKQAQDNYQTYTQKDNLNSLFGL